MSECHEMTCRRRGTSPASLPDDDNLLWEILLRLSSQPSSLPRASAVCRRWQRLVTDPQFLRRFRAHHRKPPILGFFEGRHEFVFMSILDPPDRIRPERFSLRRDRPLGCRHGRVLVQDWERNEVIVCDPITGECIHVAAPPEFKYYSLNGAVPCAADEQGHVHGSCHSSPFKVVILVSMQREDLRLIACVYSSKTGVWGNFISAAVPHSVFATDNGWPATLAGKGLYWFLKIGGMDTMLEFGLDRQSLTVIEVPPVTDSCSQRIIKAGDGGVGLARLFYPSLQIWQRKVNCHGVATWVLQKTAEMHNILGLPSKVYGQMSWLQTIVGYAEDEDVVFLYVDTNVYMVHLESMQVRGVLEAEFGATYLPFSSFYTAGTAIAGGYDGADIIHDT